MESLKKLNIYSEIVWVVSKRNKSFYHFGFTIHTLSWFLSVNFLGLILFDGLRVCLGICRKWELSPITVAALGIQIGKGSRKKIQNSPTPFSLLPRKYTQINTHNYSGLLLEIGLSFPFFCFPEILKNKVTRKEGGKWHYLLMLLVSGITTEKRRHRICPKQGRSSSIGAKMYSIQFRQ